MTHGRRLPVLPVALDPLVALVLGTIAQAEVWGRWRDGGVGGPYRGSLAVEAVMVVLFCAPLAWRRKQPLAALAVICGALVVQVLFVAPEVPFLVGLVPMVVMNYTVAAYGPRGWRFLGLLAVIATEAALFARIAELRSSGEILFSVFVVAGTWMVGEVSRTRLRHVERSADRASRIEAERDEWTQVALAEERLRIARELHDVVAHSVSLMGVQAGAARMLLDAEPGRAREVMQSIEETARESVAELKRLLGVLRGGVGPPAVAPQPGLKEIGALVDQVRSTGLTVDLAVEGEPRALPAGIALVVYRVVQEALTNALKHAGGARAEVRIGYLNQSVEIEVRDDGTGPQANGNGRGHGLIGMRERTTLYGGSFDAGPRPGGGFGVRALLPLQQPGS